MGATDDDPHLAFLPFPVALISNRRFEMVHPYKRLAHKNDPSWLRGIQKYVEKANMDDEKSTVRNYASDPKQTALAGYSIDEEKK